MDSLRTTSDYLRLTGEVSIRIPALPRPTLYELQEHCSWIKAIEEDISPEESVIFALATVLRKNEVRIGGELLMLRLASRPKSLLGYQHFRWLLDHETEYPALMALLGKVYIDFLGIIVLDARGIRHFACCRMGGWHRLSCWCRYDCGFNENGRLACVEN
jgi:hypothetical protein